MSNDSNPAIAAFAVAARDYCSFVDDPSSSDRDLEVLARLLARLGLLALDLPDSFDGDAPELAEGPVATGLIAKRFETIPFDLYWDVFDPLEASPQEPVANSVLDDLGDIYSDLRRGLALFDSGHMGAASWSWQFHFWAHWGEHLVGVQRAIYLFRQANR